MERAENSMSEVMFHMRFNIEATRCNPYRILLLFAVLHLDYNKTAEKALPELHMKNSSSSSNQLSMTEQLLFPSGHGSN